MSDRYYCFPDIHGCYDLLIKALNYVRENNPNGGKIIFLGDYIDRGHDNDSVLDEVMNPPADWQYICLLGNHEDMMLGNQIYDYNATQQIRNMKNYGEVMLWMNSLKLFHIEDGNVFAHAFYNDARGKADQYSQECLWYRMGDSEPYHNEKQGLYLTHGHTPRKNGPVFAQNRVNLDAGAVFYGRYVIGEYLRDVKGPVKFHEFERYMNK